MRRILTSLALTALLVAFAGCSLTPVESYWDPGQADLDPGRLEIVFTEAGAAVGAGETALYTDPVRLSIDGDFIGTPVGSTQLVLPPGAYTIGAQAEGMMKSEEIVILPAGRQTLYFQFGE